MDLKRPAGSLKRRHLIGGMSAIALGSFATSLVPANAEPNGETSVHQDIAFKAAPSRVYDAITDEKQFSAFSGGSAVISKEIGGEFKLFGGLQGIKGVTGRNVELVPHERIVQAWRANLWPVGVYFHSTKRAVHLSLQPQHGPSCTGNRCENTWRTKVRGEA
jgi:activator of HSP90 ATPase